MLSMKMIDLNSHKIIMEYRNYSGGHGGWLCKLTDYTSARCSYGSCSYNKLGKFKERKGWGLTF